MAAARSKVTRTDGRTAVEDVCISPAVLASTSSKEPPSLQNNNRLVQTQAAKKREKKRESFSLALKHVKDNPFMYRLKCI